MSDDTSTAQPEREPNPPPPKLPETERPSIEIRTGKRVIETKDD